MFYPKTGFAARMEKQFPNAPFSRDAKLHRIRATPFPFRCQSCGTRPGYFRRGQWLIVGCPCGTLTTDKDQGLPWPRTPRAWADNVIALVKAGKELHQKRIEQDPVAN
jgi:hypothetical protein